MANKPQMPTYVEVSDHFFNDAEEFLTRFRHCFSSDGPRFDVTYSMRVKVFLDLRMAMESVLKAYAAYYVHSSLSGKALIKKVEKYQHSINDLYADCHAHIQSADMDDLGKMCRQLSRLPAGLRYKLDAEDFRENRPQIYDQTIGDTPWLIKLAALIEKLISALNQDLKQHNEPVSIEDVCDALLPPKHIKYPNKMKYEKKPGGIEVFKNGSHVGWITTRINDSFGFIISADKSGIRSASFKSIDAAKAEFEWRFEKY